MTKYVREDVDTASRGNSGEWRRQGDVVARWTSALDVDAGDLAVRRFPGVDEVLGVHVQRAVRAAAWKALVPTFGSSSVSPSSTMT